MSEIKKSRTSAGNHDLVVPEVVAEYYADGIHTALMGLPICKMVFYRVTALPTDAQLAEDVEPREVAFRVAMPLNALLEFAKNVLATAEQNRPNMAEALDAYKLQVEKAFNPIKEKAEFTPDEA